MADFSQNWAERQFLGNCLQFLRKPSRISTKDWAEANRFLTSDVSSRPGKYSASEVPWMLKLMDLLDDPTIKVIVGKKSAQIAWTETVNCWLGKIIDVDPRNVMLAFPRAASMQKFYKEKLTPFFKHTPVLKEKLGNLTKVSHKHIPFPGGFLVLANAGTAEDGKSSVIPYIIVEEPDGVKENVNNQGDGMEILKQRMKSFSDSKLVYAGTPTDKDFSQVDIAYERSNKMVYMVPCHHCNEFNPLSFDNLKCDINQDRRIDPVYGLYNPYTAYYQCPSCQQPWTFIEKNANVKRAVEFFDKGWYATNPAEQEIYGLAFNELLSNFEASNFVNLAKQKLAAELAYEQGKEGLMKAFTNNSKGEAYAPLETGISVEDLVAKRLNYPEGIVPYEGLILTCGIDVQHNRFAIVVRAWGRNGNSWLVNWTEIWGNVRDYSDSVWERLSDYIMQGFPHAVGNGRKLEISCGTIDSADGKTTELVYRWVLDMREKGVNILAGRGINDLKWTSFEIYNEPSVMNANTFEQERRSLAQTMGANVFIIGAHRAHEEILRRYDLKGTRDRHYHCATAYGGYEEQILSCRRACAAEGEKVGFKLIPGRRKEALDCEKMALHAAYALQLRNFTNAHWSAIEQGIHLGSQANGYPTIPLPVITDP